MRKKNCSHFKPSGLLILNLKIRKNKFLSEYELVQLGFFLNIKNGSLDNLSSKLLLLF